MNSRIKYNRKRGSLLSVAFNLSQAILYIFHQVAIDGEEAREKGHQYCLETNSHEDGGQNKGLNMARAAITHQIKQISDSYQKADGKKKPADRDKKIKRLVDYKNSEYRNN